jgi:hypothetical protein
MAKTSQERAAQLERIQDLWLDHMETLLNEGRIASTDLATLKAMFIASGMTLDPSRVPQGLKDKTETKHDPNEFDDMDGVLPFHKTG